MVLGIGLAASVNAQEPVKKKEIVRGEEKAELRHDIRVKRAHKKEVFRNLSKGKIKAAGKHQDVVNAKRKEIHADTKDLRAVGVKHPARDAKKEIRKQDQPKIPN